MSTINLRDDPLNSFIVAASVPLDSSHASGTLEQANALLEAHPHLATANIYTAALLGDEAGVRRFLAADSSQATAKGGPHGWDALTYLCFSRYLRLDRTRTDGFVGAARALLDAGANANSGFFSNDHLPSPEFESVLYGAAGIAHEPKLTQLLLERGANPNDGEVAYHSPETWDNAALKLLVQTGQLTEDNLAIMLLRKTDWHDYEGVKWLLEQGVNPNRMTGWGKTALHNAALSDNAIEIFEVLLDHGADPKLPGERPEACRSAAGRTAIVIAARRGRGDVLNLLASRGVGFDLEGVDRLIAACAQDDCAQVRTLIDKEPHLVAELLREGGKLLAEFAGNGNTSGVRQLLDLGVPVTAVHVWGDGYFGVARNSMALHAAAWRLQPETVKLLLERGAPVNVTDGEGRTPLALAVSASVESYWREKRSSELVRALLERGASIREVKFPSGDAELDALLKAQGAGA